MPGNLHALKSATVVSISHLLIYLFITIFSQIISVVLFCCILWHFELKDCFPFCYMVLHWWFHSQPHKSFYGFKKISLSRHQRGQHSQTIIRKPFLLMIITFLQNVHKIILFILKVLLAIYRWMLLFTLLIYHQKCFFQ